MNLISLAVRMIPILVCLDPEHSYRENIATISAYLWVIMVSMESILHISPQVFFVFRSIFSCLYFLVLFIFFKGTLLKKELLYISAWLLAILSASLSEPAVWILKGHVSLACEQTRVAVSLLWTCGFYGFMQFWLRDKVDRFLDQLSRQSCSLLLTHSSVSLPILFIEDNTVFSSRSPAEWGLEDVLFYLALYVMTLALCVLILNSTLEIIRRCRMGEKLQPTRQLISQQRKHYNRALDYIEQMHIIEHNFHHHIHTLLSIGRGERTNYLMDLKGKLDVMAGMVFCQNQTVNESLQEYVVRARQDGMEFAARVDLSAHVPVDDLTLCTIIGNLLENVLEVCHHLTKPRFILVQIRWLNDHLMILMENSYNGQIKENGSGILSNRRDGGLGMLNVKCILNQPGDESDVDYNDTTPTIMVKIANKALGQDVLFNSFPAQNKVKALQSS